MMNPRKSLVKDYSYINRRKRTTTINNLNLLNYFSGIKN